MERTIREIESNENEPLLSKTQDDAKHRRTYTWTLLLSCLVCSITGTSMGFDVGVMADAIVDIKAQWDLSFFQEELCLGILNIVAAFGALLALGTAEEWGRRRTVAVSSTLLIVGLLIMGGSASFTWLMVGRIIAGSGIGVSYVCVPVYISELATPEVRGSMGSLFEISINSGVALGYLVGYLCQASLSSDTAWRVMFYFGTIPPTCVLLSLWFIPESPRWLVSMGLRAEALDALKRTGDDAAAETVKVIDRELIITREAQLDNNAHQTKMDNEVIMIAALIGLMQQVSGAEAILYYSSDFLKDAGMTSDLSQMLGELAIGVSKLLPGLILFNHIDDFERRTYLIGSAAGVTAVLVSLMMVFIAGDQPTVTVVLLCLYMVFFSCGLGLVTWTVTSEMLPNHIRTRGMVAVAFSNRIASGITATTALSIVDLVGYTGLFAWYSALGLLALLFYITMVPETSRRSLEDISAARR